MYENNSSPFGRGKIDNLNFTPGKHFFVVSPNSPNNAALMALFGSDNSGSARVFPSVTAALAQCVAGRQDQILVYADYTTAPTAADILNAETKGVSIIPMGTQQIRQGVQRAYRPAGTLPQTASGALFTVTGRVRIIQISGQVTTAFQALANATKITAVPTIGANVDLTATSDVTGQGVGVQLFSTGVIGAALGISNGGAYAYQPTSMVVMPGTINLVTAASATGAAKWYVDYEPIDPGAMVIPA